MSTDPIHSGANSLPDLVVTSLSYNASSGIFACTVYNQGSAATPTNTWVGVEFSVDGKNAAWGGITTSLASNQSLTITSSDNGNGAYGSGPYTIGAGTHTISVLADDQNKIAESNENNNTLSQQIQVGAPSPNPSPSPNQTNASRAADFQHIWGTAGHAGSYNNTTKLAADIQYAGIKQWRDGTGDASRGAFQAIASQGLTFVALPWYTSGTTVDIPTTISELKTMANQGVLGAIEGLNEPINFPITYQGQTSSGSSCKSGCTFAPVASWQRDFYAAVKADPVLRNYPVYGATLVGAEQNNVGLQYLTIPSPAPAGVIFPAGTVFADYQCEHIYTIYQGSAQTIANGTDYIQRIFNSDYVTTWNGYSGYPQAQANALPKVITEFGYQVGTPSRNGLLVDQTTAGKNIVTGLLNAYAEGYQLAAIYTFYPWSGDSGWNLFSAPGAPLPAATYMHNLAGPISDTAASARTFAPGDLSYTLSGMPSTATSLLLQKSNGQFELVLWNNVSNWNVATGAPIAVNPTNVTVNLGASAANVNVYDITSGTTPISTLTHTNSVTVPLKDYAMVVEITL